MAIAAGIDREAGPGAVTGIREGKCGISIRIFTSGVRLKAEAAGLKYHAARLAIYQTERSKHVRVGLLIFAEKCADEVAFAALMKRAADSPVHDETDGTPGA